MRMDLKKAIAMKREHFGERPGVVDNAKMHEIEAALRRVPELH